MARLAVMILAGFGGDVEFVVEGAEGGGGEDEV
jgi:hypothetical protein